MSKKNKNKKKQTPIVVETPVEIVKPSPKKNKSKTEKLNALILEDITTPSRKSKGDHGNHHKHSRNDSVSEESTTSSPKKKHKKEKKHKIPVKVKDEESEEEAMFDELIPPVITEENGDPEAEIDLLEIPKADLQLLLNGIQKLLPETESITPKARTKKLDWEKVAFGDYTAERCAKIWDAIQKRQRQYRYMSEPWRSAKKKPPNNIPIFPSDLNLLSFYFSKMLKLTLCARRKTRKSQKSHALVVKSTNNFPKRLNNATWTVLP
ncbi:uncharacterized protein [Atheta coriaria]|uniref:uncharacterized protein n=1 Tax=Dalotia coriaria TaxID=877792 RepID=UPI0031F44D6E